MRRREKLARSGCVGVAQGVRGAFNPRLDDEQVMRGQVQRDIAVQSALLLAVEDLVELIAHEQKAQSSAGSISGHTRLAYPPRRSVVIMPDVVGRDVGAHHGSIAVDSGNMHEPWADGSKVLVAGLDQQMLSTLGLLAKNGRRLIDDDGL